MANINNESKNRMTLREQHRLSQRESNKRTLPIIIFTIILLMIVLLIPAIGYYWTYVMPENKVVISVGETEIQLRDLLKRTKANAAAEAAFGSEVKLSLLPFETLNAMTDHELLRQTTPTINLYVTSDEIDQEIRNVHYPRTTTADQSDKDALDREFVETYQSYLNITKYSDKEYRDLIQMGLLRTKLTEYLGDRIPTIANSVNLKYIKFSEITMAEQAYQQLQSGADFSQLARIYMKNDAYADDNGLVGWVPEGAFPELDPTIFNMELNTFSEPILTNQNSVIVQITAGPEPQPLQEKMTKILKQNATNSWLDEQRDKLNVRIDFNSQDYQWMVEKINRYVS
ncbi:MAG: hypothetical protein FI695_03170 [SAR202 cluster bacterium]|nr:hypothetical protein [Chloroflexota bacterium]MQG50961.1 hypothetical protein [SAR202 cluster bacterium]|tara:strand:+ start:5611 stop:6639 length:1029 start_codon:yes stop_codon:yes gene_type:complete